MFPIDPTIPYPGANPSRHGASDDVLFDIAKGGARPEFTLMHLRKVA
jgi:hypothetical protein